jgi:hypothetical protein
MKNIVRGHWPRLLVALAATALLYACGSGGGGEPAPVVVTPPPIEAAQNLRYQLVLTDTASGQPVSDPLSVTFVGTPQVKAADGTVLNGKTVTATGVVAFDAAFTSTAKDLSIQVADAGGKGWIPTGISLSAPAGTTGDQTVNLKMVNTNQAAAVTASTVPVTMAVKSATAAADGSLTAPVSVATTPKTVTNQEGTTETIGVVKLDLATGTKGTTASGTPAAPGALTVSSSYYSNSNSQSLAAFPGGFAANVQVPATSTAVLNGAAADTGAFVTGGFAQFNVTDSAGKAIKNFDKPVTVGIDLPKTSKDLDGNQIVVGSDYPVWSYNDTTGEWVFEKMGKVAEKSPVDPNNFTVVFDTNHLSSWNLDFFGPTCTGQINLVGRPANDKRQLQVDIVGTTGARFGHTLYPTDSALTVSRVPSKVRANVIVKDRGQVVGQVTSQALCNGSSALAVNVPIALLSANGTARVDTSEGCTDPTLQPQQRAVPTLVNVNVYPLVTGVLPTPGTTSVTGTATVASFTFTSLTVPSTGTATMVASALDPRSAKSVTQTFTLTAAQPNAVVPFKFPLTCKLVSGGG